MGRPPIKDPRTQGLTVKVSQADRRAIERAAKAAGLSIGGYVRKQLGLED